jgi:hypothetical protein
MPSIWSPWVGASSAVAARARNRPAVAAYPQGNRLLVVVNRDLLAEGPAQAVACVGRADLGTCL